MSVAEIMSSCRPTSVFDLRPKNQPDVRHLRFAQSRALTRNVSHEFTFFGYAADTIARFIGVVMINRHGGARQASIRPMQLACYGFEAIQSQLVKPLCARSEPATHHRLHADRWSWQARGCLQQNSGAGGLTPTRSRLYLYERARLRGASSALDTPIAIISASVSRSSTSEIASRTLVIIKRTVQVFTFLQSRHRR